MKRFSYLRLLLIVLIVAALILVFTSCGKNPAGNSSDGRDLDHTDNKISLEAIVSSEADSAKIIVKNNGNLKISFGEDYYIQKKTNNGWKDVKEQIDHNVNLVLFQAPAGDNYTFDVNWSQLYGKLEPGEYRIVKPYQKGEAFSRDGETFYAFAEFTVGEK